MSDEKIDKAKAAKDRFLNQLNDIKTVNDYREFVISFFYSQQEQEDMLNILGLAALANVDLNKWQAFKDYFRTVAYREFSKKIRTFITEEAKLGFML